MNWPSAPVVVADALRREFGVIAGTRLEPDSPLPAIAVTRQGGGDDGVTDAARIELVVVANNEAEAESLSEQVRNFLTSPGPVEGAGYLLDRVRTEVGPRRVPYPDDQISEYVASYVAISRQQ